MGRLSNKLANMTHVRQLGGLCKDLAEVLDYLEGIGCIIERSGNRWKVNVVDGGAGLPAATTQYKVLAVNSSIEWQEDWVRWP